MSLTDLTSLPDGVAAADTQIRKLDAVLMRGFARLGDADRDGLTSFGKTFIGTPLAESLDTSIAAILAGDVKSHDLAQLAHGRIALDGARFDALNAQAHGALPVSGPVIVEGQAGPDVTPDAATLMSSAREWLLEVALAGFLQLESATVAPFVPVLEAIQGQPQLFRLSSLLTGFVFELLDHVPTAALETVPERRWADLWARAMLWSNRPPQSCGRDVVSGTFKALGVDMRHHDNLASAAFYGVLESESGARLVKATLTAWKVDAVTGVEIWSLFKERGEVLLNALAKSKAVEIVDMPLSATGDLYWDARRATLTRKKSVPMDTASKLLGGDSLAALGVLPLDRHPVQLALPCFLPGCQIDGLTITSGGASLPWAIERQSALGPDEAAVRKSSALFGLLRFDQEGWRFQPLAADGKLGVAPGIVAGLKAKGAAPLLKERASRLLRGKR